MRWLQQFEPDTEVPDDTIFGRMPERKAPTYLHRAGNHRPAGQCAAARAGASLRGIIYETLFGLIASDGPADQRGAVAEERRRRSQDRHADHSPDQVR
jgi:hypothetical protein